MKPKRFMELEGLRGVAAIAVVLWHFSYAFYPALTTGNLKLAHTTLEPLIYGSVFGFLYSGTFAVAIFFVLSGFVLSIGYFKTGSESIVRKLAMARYLRLMVPALASILVAYLFIKLGFSRFPDFVAGITGSEWLGRFWNVDPSSISVVKNGVVDIFMGTGSTFNNVLWTMHTEFFGSFAVFAFLMFFAKYKLRWAVYIGLMLATFNTWFLPFMLGMLLADMYAHGYLERLRRVYIIVLLGLGGVFLGSFPNSRVSGTLFEPLTKLHLDLIVGSGIDYRILYFTIGATMVVMTVLLGKSLARLLSLPKIAVLGKYTFALYLTHLIVLYVFACTVFSALQVQMGYNKAVLLTCALSIPVIAIVTVLFEKYVDTPAILFSKYVTAVIRGERRIEWREIRRSGVCRVKNMAEKYIGLSGEPSSNFGVKEK